MQRTPHHVAELEPRPATLPGLLAVTHSRLNQSIRSSATFCRGWKADLFAGLADRARVESLAQG